MAVFRQMILNSLPGTTVSSAQWWLFLDIIIPGSSIQTTLLSLKVGRWWGGGRGSRGEVSRKKSKDAASNDLVFFFLQRQ